MFTITISQDCYGKVSRTLQIGNLQKMSRTQGWEENRSLLFPVREATGRFNYRWWVYAICVYWWSTDRNWVASAWWAKFYWPNQPQNNTYIQEKKSDPSCRTVYSTSHGYHKPV